MKDAQEYLQEKQKFPPCCTVILCQKRFNQHKTKIKPKLLYRELPRIDVSQDRCDKRQREVTLRKVEIMNIRIYAGETINAMP